MLTIEDVQAAIRENDRADWQAADTPIFRRGVARGAGGLFGLRVDAVLRFRTADLPLMEEAGPEPPSHVDWREAAEAAVTPPKDQGDCGACVAFATCAVLESAAAIHHGAGLDLSEAHLFHCNGGSCDEGWGLTSGLDAARGGVGLAADLPWSPSGGCREIAPRISVSAYRAWSSPRDRRLAVQRGPVLAGMRVFEDLLSYEGGVYRKVIGEEVGQHAVCVVGYDDPGGYWILKNSWGDRFGEAGFFRVAYGECGLDDEFLFFSATTVLVR